MEHAYLKYDQMVHNNWQTQVNCSGFHHISPCICHFRVQTPYDSEPIHFQWIHKQIRNYATNDGKLLNTRLLGTVTGSIFYMMALYYSLGSILYTRKSGLYSRSSILLVHVLFFVILIATLISFAHFHCPKGIMGYMLVVRHCSISSDGRRRHSGITPVFPPLCCRYVLCYNSSAIRLFMYSV